MSAAARLAKVGDTAADVGKVQVNLKVIEPGQAVSQATKAEKGTRGWPGFFRRSEADGGTIKWGNVAKVGAGAGGVGILSWAMFDPKSGDKIGDVTGNLGNFIGSAFGNLFGGLGAGLAPLSSSLIVPSSCLCCIILSFLLIQKS